MTPLLSTRDLAVGYDATSPVLSHITLDLNPGRLISLLGANGRGKSTLMRTLAALQPPLSGSIIIDGKDMRDITPRLRAGLVSIVTTDNTASGLTVSELTALGRHPHTGFFGRLSHHDREIVRDAISAVGMSQMTDRRAGTLSDGERQKVMIARAIAQDTPLIMLDEPTAFLDAAARIEIINLLRRIAHQRNRLIIVSSHDINTAVTLSDELLLAMPDGTLRHGVPEELEQSTDALPSLFEPRPVSYDGLTHTFITKQ